MTTMKNLMGLRNAVLLTVGVTLVLLLVNQGQAWAGPARGTVIGQPPSPYVISTPILPDPPTVSWMSPQPGTTGVSRNTNIEVSFSEPVDPATVNTTTFLLYRDDNSQLIPATVSRASTDTIGIDYMLDPYGSGAGRLDPTIVYRVVVTTGVKDKQDGLQMTYDKEWRFTTGSGTAPYVTQVSPQGGATGVARGTNAKVTFSEPIDPASINTSTLQLRYYDVLCTSRYYDPYNPCYFSMYQISATVSKDPNDPSGRTWVIDPASLLDANKNYMVRVTTGVRDLEDEYPLPSNKEWSFKTGSY